MMRKRGNNKLAAVTCVSCEGGEKAWYQYNTHQIHSLVTIFLKNAIEKKKRIVKINVETILSVLAGKKKILVKR